MKYYFLVFASCLFFMTSCEKGVVYEHEVKIDGIWDYEKSLDYAIPIQDTTTRYDLIAKVSHDADFSYQNFYVALTTSFPDGKALTDDVSFQLADGMGSWQGKCNGATCQVELVLQQRFRFQQIGDYVLSIRNNSREELTGINAVELRLVEFEMKEKKVD